MPRVRYSMISAIGKIRSLVFESCITSPDTVVLIEMSVGSKPVARARLGPIGVNVSKLLPSVNWRSGVSSCARRPETSSSAVTAPTYDHASSRRDPVGAPADHDGDLALVVGARLLARDHDLVVRPGDRGRVHREDDGHLGDGEVGLDRVRAVVEADREDLARRHRREQAHRVEGVRRRRSPRRAAPRPRPSARSPAGPRGRRR